MAFCGNCGTKTEDGLATCPSCGAMLGVSANAAQDGQAQGPMPGQTEARDAQENKTMAILAYILFFIPLLSGAHKNSPFVLYHTNQGTVLVLVYFVWYVITRVLGAILGIIPVIGWIIILAFNLSYLIFFALCIMGILNAINGVMKPLPVIGGYTLIK